MLEKLRIIFTIPELRWKIAVTLGFLAIYRIGWQIPLPITDQSGMQAWANQQTGVLAQVINQVALFSASSLNQATIFGLGIMPYISASIIFQLLASVWAPLEALKKEGEAGQRKINEYTRYATVVLCVIQSIAFLQLMQSQQLIRVEVSIGDKATLTWGWWLLSILTMTTGTIFLMWIGEQIDEYGIGNGISLLIMAGILADMPGAALDLWQQADRTLGSAMGPDRILLLAILFISVVTGVVLITQGQRRIPTQTAKHTRGHRVFGGGRQYLPLRVNQAGVMPIIFASSLLMLPPLIFTQALYSLYPWEGFQAIANWFQPGPGFVYNVTYVAMIYFFCYFWTAIVFNPQEMADNLKQHGSFIPGYRPGKRTADYLEKVMIRITYVGAGFLALVAVLPTMVGSWANLNYKVAQFYGGTGLLIAVSVAFDLVQKIDSHLVMRNYSGLLDR